MCPASAGWRPYVVLDDGRADADDNPWKAHWEALHSQGIETAAANGSSQSPIAALLGGMGAEDLQKQERECIDQTLDRIRALRPARILEIGAGTGDFVLPLAPECVEYVATDYAESAVDYLRALVPSNVLVRQQAADDFSGIAPGRFDVVVLHSVSQYLPDADYLRRVLAGAVRAVRPGGHVYVGDVQSFALLRAHHSGNQTRRAPASLPVSELKERIERRVNQEIELVIDPGFFHAFQEQNPGVGQVEIQLRRGRVRIEMTKFHYDVILHVGGSEPTVEVARWQHWADEQLDLPKLREQLALDETRTLGVRGIPNARLQDDLAVVNALSAARSAGTVGELRDVLAREAGTRLAGVDPEDLWTLGDSLGYATAVNWSADAAGADGCCEVIFHRDAGIPVFPHAAARAETPSGRFTNQPWKSPAANDPKRPDADLAASLRAYLKNRLPDYMIPAAFVPLASLPLTPNGKVDRRALPAPDFSRSISTPDAAQAPGSPLEKYLAALWSEILGVEKIGQQDNFFETGGDSLLGLRMVNRLRDSLGEHVSLVVVFEAPTIQALAQNPGIELRARRGKTLRIVHPATGGRREPGGADQRGGRGPDAADHRPRASARGARASRRRIRPAVFILSPMRSGSTLLRIMLAGNPRTCFPRRSCNCSSSIPWRSGAMPWSVTKARCKRGRSGRSCKFTGATWPPRKP